LRYEQVLADLAEIFGAVGVVGDGFDALTSDFAVDRAEKIWTIAVDGRSGSGKTSLAKQISGNWLGSSPLQVIQVDDFCGGWSGLAEVSQRLVTDFLLPRAAGKPGTLRRYDWKLAEFAELVTIEPHVSVLIEGCGSVTASAKPYLDYAVWLEAETSVRKQRALSRDPEFVSYWELWAAQEKQLYEEEKSVTVADRVFYIKE
jgi:uridine kinase